MSHQPMMDEPVTAIFSLECDEPRAWLVLNQQGKLPRVIAMWQPHAGFWSACAVVFPGEYRCRCYGGNDRITAYYGPPTVASGIPCGMDTLLIVQRSIAVVTAPFLADARDERINHPFEPQTV